MEVKALDEQMQRAFSNMKPAVTLEMIRRGENPLDMNMEQLNQVAQEIQQENGTKEQERFSKYLWKLEQNHEISEEERSSYIGIYRLIAQVEKGDGAALGFLMNQGSDVTMRNLLRAVRQKKRVVWIIRWTMILMELTAQQKVRKLTSRSRLRSSRIVCAM